MAKEPERQLKVLVNKAAGRVEIIGLVDGSQAYSINLTQDQAEHHARTLIEAIEMLNADRGKPKLIIPAVN